MASNIDAILAKYRGGGTQPGGEDRVSAIMRKYSSPGPLKGEYKHAGPETPPAGIAKPDFEPKAAAPKPSQLEAGVRGVSQGLSLGFADEVSGTMGGVGAAGGFGPQTFLPGASSAPKKTVAEGYREARDDHRAADEAAKKEHPKTYTGAEIGGSIATGFVPGLNVAKGATLGVKAGKAAATGGAAALGASESDITRGDVAGAAKDTAIGAGAGAALAGTMHGAGKVLDGAAKRFRERPADALLGKARGKARDHALDKLGGREGVAAELRSDKGLLAATKKGPRATADAVDERLDEVGGQIGKTIEEADKASPGLPAQRVYDALESLKANAVKEADHPKIAAIDKEIEGLRKLWGQDVATAGNVWGAVKRYGRKGFGTGSDLHPSDAKKLGREMNAAVREVLHEHVQVTTEGGKDALRALNDRYSRLSALGDVADDAAKKAETNTLTVGEKMERYARGAAGATALYSGIKDLEAGQTPSLTTAIPAAIAGGRQLGKMGDALLAGIRWSLRSGMAGPEVVRRAVEAGLPRAAAENAVEEWGGK